MQITERIKVTNEDNMVLMSRYPDKHFDLAIVDPPYGIGADKAQNNGSEKFGYKKYKDTDWDSEIPNAEYFSELKRVSKNQIVWGGNYMTTFLNPSMGWIIWDKGQRNFTLADGEMAWTSFNKAMRIFEFSRCASIIDNNIGGKKFHPTAKPIQLYKWIFDKYSKPNFKILDTHFGSGSIAIAFDEMIQYWISQDLDVEGAELVACELDEEYFEKSVKRIQDHTSQLKLF